MLSWVIFSFLMLTFFLVYVPLLEDHDSRLWAAFVYGVLLTAVIIGWVIASSTDPVDKTIFYLLQATPREYPSGELLYCCFCKCKVHKRSKHCRVCNKCVGDFDHHCKWLNNCVGGANYGIFFFLINAAAALTAFHSGWGVKIVMDAWEDDSFPQSSRAGDWFSSLDRTGLLSLLVVSTVTAGGVCVLLLHLVGFHIYLISKKLSTYDYILLQRAKAVEKQNRKDERKNNRVGAELQETSLPVGEISDERSRTVSMVESQTSEECSSHSKQRQGQTPSAPTAIRETAGGGSRPKLEEPPEQPAMTLDRPETEADDDGCKCSEAGKKAIRLKPLPPSAHAMAEAQVAEHEVRGSALLPGVVATGEETPMD